MTGGPPITPPSPDGSPSVRAIVTCHGCGRTLLERRGTKHFIDLNGHRCEVVDFRFRPWMAVVITRVRDVEGGVGAIHVGEGETARTVQVRERAQICSRACLNAVRDSFAFDPSPDVVATLHPPTIKDGDDLISHLLASTGPIPDVPSDEWRASGQGQEEP